MICVNRKVPHSIHLVFFALLSCNGAVASEVFRHQDCSREVMKQVDKYWNADSPVRQEYIFELTVDNSTAICKKIRRFDLPQHLQNTESNSFYQCGQALLSGWNGDPGPGAIHDLSARRFRPFSFGSEVDWRKTCEVSNNSATTTELRSTTIHLQGRQIGLLHKSLVQVYAIEPPARFW